MTGPLPHKVLTPGGARKPPSDFLPKIAQFLSACYQIKPQKEQNATASSRYIFGLGVEFFGVLLTPGTRLNGHLTRTMKLKTWPKMCSALLRTQLLSVENTDIC